MGAGTLKWQLGWRWRLQSEVIYWEVVVPVVTGGSSGHIHSCQRGGKGRWGGMSEMSVCVCLSPVCPASCCRRPPVTLLVHILTLAKLISEVGSTGKPHQGTYLQKW